MPTQLMTMRHTGPVLTLNVQMSLYDSNLAAFLSTEQTPPTHCFHPCISLELLGNIISGVQYLHSKGVVHRDLKPANIFLALSDDRYPPAGSVDLSSCDTCPAKKCLHVTPRIGDFGLVAAVGDSGARPVGTELYRPPNGGKIDEKLDVFALGVVAFEMLNYFGTKMERIDALNKLRRGEIGGDFGEGILELIGEMVAIDEEKRLDCELVRKQIKKIVGEMKRD
jgi:translation initiation factor 2-alpha kinase 3